MVNRRSYEANLAPYWILHRSHLVRGKNDRLWKANARGGSSQTHRIAPTKRRAATLPDPRRYGINKRRYSSRKACFGCLEPCRPLGLQGSQISVAFAAKIEMAKWSVFAWIGRSTGLIYVDRKYRMSTGSFVESVRERMRNGVAVLVFPEGMTNADYELLPFKSGGFATVAEMPDGFVLPVYNLGENAQWRADHNTKSIRGRLVLR